MREIRRLEAPLGCNLRHPNLPALFKESDYPPARQQMFSLCVYNGGLDVEPFCLGLQVAH